VERDRGIGDDPGDQDRFAVEQSCHVRPCFCVDSWCRRG
jgi:hypothetical protein